MIRYVLIMVLCKLKNLPDSGINVTKWETSIKKYAKNYIKAHFNPLRRKGSEAARLKEFENYLKSYINISNISLYKIILYIIDNIYIIKDIIYIKEILIYNKKIENIYRLFTYGNLDIRGNNLIEQAFVFALRRTAEKRFNYGN